MCLLPIETIFMLFIRVRLSSCSIYESLLESLLVGASAHALRRHLTCYILSPPTFGPPIPYRMLINGR